MRRLFVLMCLVSMVLGCTHVRTVESGSTKSSSQSTVGVANVTRCLGPTSEQATVVISETDEQRLVIMRCSEIVHSESNGFTGWDMLDAALTGFLSWVTFGAITI